MPVTKSAKAKPGAQRPLQRWKTGIESPSGAQWIGTHQCRARQGLESHQMAVSPQRTDRGDGRFLPAATVMASARLLFLMVAFLAAGRGHAASAHFTRLSVEDGLSMSSVESIAEDRYGFLWFGTQEGLNRFDGYEFAVHQASTRPGDLRDGFIRALTPDRSGNLWVGTRTGLQHLDVSTGRFSESVAPPEVGVRLNTLRVAPDGRLWFGGNNGGLWTREPSGTSEARRVVTDGITADASVSAVAIDQAGNLWVAADGDLVLLRPSEAAPVAPTSETLLAGAGPIRDIHVERGVLWLGRFDAPLLRFDPVAAERTEYRRLPHSTLSIASAGDGWLWLGGKGAGVTRFHTGTGNVVTYRHEPGNEHSLAEDDVAVVHQDRGGSLWVGAWNGGLSRLNLYSQAFRTFRYTPGQPDSLPDNDVTRLTEGPDGRLWVITRNDLLAVGDPATGAFTGVPFERDLTAIHSPGAELFVGTRSGLSQLDPASGAVLEAHPAIRTAGLDRAPIEGLAGKDDHLWILSEGILYRLAPDERLRSVALPLKTTPTSVHAASADTLWLAFPEGVVLHAAVAGDGILVGRVGGHNLSERGRLSAIAEREGIVWVGASRGLGRLTPANGRVEWMEFDRGLPSRSIAGILPDDEHLWISTERGITRFDPRTRQAVQFGSVQGAQSSGYVEGGVLRGASGRYYFAGQGITQFDPRRVVDNPYRLKVVFTSLEILHQSVPPAWMDADSPLQTALHAAREVTLGPADAVFSIEMAAPGATDPDGVHFAHRLVGFDDEWIETDADRRVATYTRLAPGTYVLRARARARSGPWSDHEAVLTIRVLPPWWRTPAALVLWLTLAALLIALAIREARRRTRVRIALAEQEALRRASVTDPLTGLYNRRFLAEWLKHEVPRVLRANRTGESPDRQSLLFIATDLDNLKQINDRFGHDAGDRAICAAAGLLQSHARAEDLAVRLGGDEFLLVLRSADRSQAARIVERLRSGAATLEWSVDDSLAPTISLGFASFPFVARHPEALTWEQTLQLADRALLYSKRRGRNAWTGFVATRMTSGAAVLEHLQSDGDASLSSIVRIEQGPNEDQERLSYSER